MHICHTGGRRIAGRCSVLQCIAVCVAVCCSVLQCVAVCCSALQCVTGVHPEEWVYYHLMLQWVAFCCSGLLCVLQVCCSSTLWRVSVLLHCSVLHVLKSVAFCWSSSQRVAACCSVFQCVQCVAVVRSKECVYYRLLWKRDAVCWGVLQCVAFFCSVLQCMQCVAVRCSALKSCHTYKWVMSSHTYEWVTSRLKLQKIWCHQGQICQREMMDATHCNIPQQMNVDGLPSQPTIGLFFMYICNTPQHNATHCNTLQHIAMHCNRWMLTGYLQEWRWDRPLICVCMQHTATHYNTLQHTATHCNTLHHTATHGHTLLHTATHCST